MARAGSRGTSGWPEVRVLPLPAAGLRHSTEASDRYLSGADSLEGLLANNGVNLTFNGHAHTYARSTPTGMPVGYVTGGGGAKLEPATVCGSPIAAALGWSRTR